MNRDGFDIVAFANAVMRPVFTVADEPLVRFRIFVMFDDTETVPLYDDFEVDRKAAWGILRTHRRAGDYIERRDGGFYIEPKQ